MGKVIALFLLGGWVMWPILGVSIVALSAIINRSVHLVATRGDALELTREVLALIDAGRLEEARVRCERSALPAAHLLREGLSAWGEREEELERRLELAATASLERVEASLPIIGTALALLPMLGFLGTILGLIDSFRVWAKAGADVGIEQLSGGIAAAMVTTGAGLITAIPYSLAYNVFATHASKVARSLNLAASELIGRHRARRPAHVGSIRPVGEAR